jgi:hypothetical protein
MAKLTADYRAVPTQVGLEPDEILLAAVDQGDFGEDRYAFGQLRKVDLRAVARDIPCRLQPLTSLQLRARRQAGRLRQVGVGHPTVLLQLDEDVQVDPIEFRDAVQSVLSMLPAVRDGRKG